LLSRTADHLYWMARYTERAENTARMLDASMQMALLPQPEEAGAAAWRAILAISELEPAFEPTHGRTTPAAVLEFMVRDADNPSSVASCLRAARENARAVRGTLTAEVWETHNTTWLELSKQLEARVYERHPSQFFDWVKYRSHVSRGVMIGTMLKDEAFHFARIGTFLERADNTARILDVKFFEQPAATQVANEAASRQQRDFYYWAAVLRSVSAFEIYRKVYRDAITPERVAELLILRGDMPRSLLASMNEVVANLDAVANEASGETQRRAGMLRTELHYGRIEDILAGGLHAYLSRFLARISDLGARISRDFLVPIASQTA
jgi:uncharacterized alpha-E superfamily protein